MKGFTKILKFKIYENYENARKIADDIIVSLVKNTSLEEKEKRIRERYAEYERKMKFFLFLLPVIRNITAIITAITATAPHSHTL